MKIITCSIRFQQTEAGVVYYSSMGTAITVQRCEQIDQDSDVPTFAHLTFATVVVATLSALWKLVILPNSIRHCYDRNQTQ